MIIEIIENSASKQQEYPQYDLPLLCTVSSSLLTYKGCDLADVVRGYKAEDGIVRFDDIEPEILFRFIERLESGDAAGIGFEDFDQVVDAFAIARAIVQMNESDFYNTLLRELYSDLSTNENVLPRELRSKESIRKVKSILTTVYEHEDWGKKKDAYLFP